MNIYIPKHFKLQEVLPEDFYNQYFDIYGDRLWLMLDDRIVKSADILQKMFGTMICNTWYSQAMIERYGRHEYRGWRPFNCKVGSKLSDHKWGRAIDLIPLKTTAKKIRKYLKSLQCEPYSTAQTHLFFYITCIEAGVSWLHISCRNHDRLTYGLQIVTV